MSNVTGASLLATLIAQEIRTRRRAVSTHRPEPAGAGDRPTADAQQALQQRIANRLGAIDANDPDRHGKGLKVFLEAVLLEEFGSELAEDPAFQQVLVEVHTAMLASPELAPLLRDAMAHLLP